VTAEIVCIENLSFRVYNLSSVHSTIGNLGGTTMKIQNVAKAIKAEISGHEKEIKKLNQALVALGGSGGRRGRKLGRKPGRKAGKLGPKPGTRKRKMSAKGRAAIAAAQKARWAKVKAGKKE
jgi:hypothetical protein